MVMLRPKGKAFKVAESVMKKKGVKIRKPQADEKTKLSGPYLQR